MSTSQILPWKPVPVQSQEKLPGWFLQIPSLWQGFPNSHSFISKYKKDMNNYDELIIKIEPILLPVAIFTTLSKEEAKSKSCSEGLKRTHSLIAWLV